MTTIDLPEWGGEEVGDGSGCPNPRCEATGRYLRVLSAEEMDLTYPVKNNLRFFPLPPQATHVCDRCGFAFNGIETPFPFDASDPLAGLPDVPLDDWEYERNALYNEPTRDAIRHFLEGRPSGVTDDEVLVDAVRRCVPGAGEPLARSVLADMDIDGVRAFDTSEFM